MCIYIYTLLFVPGRLLVRSLACSCIFERMPDSISINLSLSLSLSMYTYAYIYIYIYRERESYIDMHMSEYICIHLWGIALLGIL